MKENEKVLLGDDHFKVGFAADSDSPGRMSSAEVMFNNNNRIKVIIVGCM